LRQAFFIPGRLTSYTDANNARAIKHRGKSRGNRRVDGYTQLKKKETERVAWEVKLKLANGQLVPVDAERVRYYFTWVRDTRLADPDNVCHAVKYLLDGFRMAGLIPNDTWRYVSKLNNAFAHISEVEETLSMKLGEGVFVLMEWD
jgi:hypothetical protein